MEVFETKLVPPKEFPFPFTPYPIQKDFMFNLYEALEERKLGIFESPTGTGKSMSLICGSLKWLFDAQQRLKDDVLSNIKKLNEDLKKSSLGPNWLDEHASLAKNKQNRDHLQDFLHKIISMESRIEELNEKARRKSEKTKLSSKLKSSKLEFNHDNNDSQKEEESDDDILLDDNSPNGNIIDSDNSSGSEDEREEKENYYGIKIFFCSRTHSQLSQLVREIQKSPFKDLQVRIVSLASRQNYCINESVLNLKYLTLINDKCQELHDKKEGKITKTSTDGKTLKRQKTMKGCPFYQQTNIENIKLRILTKIEDIEQLVQWGKELNGCPYYASRQAINEAQLILVPYNTILHKSTRQAYGINLKDSVVIIDEAHNLLDTIGNIYSCTITGLQLAQSYRQLVQYRDKYNERFSALSLLYLNQVIFIVNKLFKKIGKNGFDTQKDSSAPLKSETEVTIETLPDFILSCEIDTINFYKVLEFVNRSNIVNKLRGFVYKYGPSVVIHENKEKKGVSAFLKTLTAKERKLEDVSEKIDETENTQGNPFMTVINFIETLTNHSFDGRIVATQGKTMETSSLKYLLLNPASHFSDIVKESRSVILAGGTMRPISEFTEQLFYLAGGTLDRVKIFTCGHIIPPNNILPITVAKGPSGKTFDFSYQHRNSIDVHDELGRLLINVCNLVPGGMVCFFPSYDYENVIYQRLEKTKVIEKLRKKKKILREPKKSNQIDKVLRDYAEAAQSQGALLFSVVGGKLSEGLNFNDDLGRCVIVVGLPYPNLTSLELREKMNYLDTAVGPNAGKTYYENLCMKAVNQSIGRSVRHKDDFSSVLLIDQRYSRPKCIKALPEWIQKSLRKEETFGPVIGHLAKFFSGRKKPV